VRLILLLILQSNLGEGKIYEWQMWLGKCCCTRVSSSAIRPFRFQAVWSTYKDYHEIVKQWRKNTCNISVSLKNVMEESQVFNKEVFGNIFRKKRV